MYSKNILIFIYIVLCINFVNTYEILTKDEVLNITNRYYISFYCKDNICVSTDYNYNDSIIEIPDENGNKKKYITHTCTYDDIKIKKCNVLKNCTIDSECLSNKCFDNRCVFNNETSIIHCDAIYTPSTLFKKKSSYMYCGKPYGETCINNDECSSKKCNMNNFRKQTEGPSDSDGVQGLSIVFIMFIILIIVAIIGICYNFYYNKYKKI